MPKQRFFGASQSAEFKRRFIVLFTTSMCLLGSLALAQAAETNTVVLAVAGQVEFAHAGTANWLPAQTNQILQVGDLFRTGERSRASLRLSDLTILPVSDRTTLEIVAPEPGSSSPGLSIRAGAIYFFGRGKPQGLQIRSRYAKAALRGTEFHLRVAEDGTTELLLIEGEVEVSNELGSETLSGRGQVKVAPGGKPERTPVLDAVNIIQWCLYYPAILDVAELSALPSGALADSIKACQSGDLLAALRLHPVDRNAATPSEQLYEAALLLAVGQAEQTESILDRLPNLEGQDRQLAGALRHLIAAVKHLTNSLSAPPNLSTEWLAESYYQQSRSRLDLAWSAAKSAVERAPESGFAWARLAEMEFGRGNTKAARAALDQSLARAPRNAQAWVLDGFIKAAASRYAGARESFEKAIALDGALGNAWLGRGLVRFQSGDTAGAVGDLQTAAALEPNRAVLRSYLGKAFAGIHDLDHAEAELKLARDLDETDPTSWLYSALVKRERNQINDAVRDIETSKALNDNRSVFRSELLLDQDRAVRSANLAGVYRDAGLTEFSAVEAARAVNWDYGNYSAHLFLANSYDALRDPRLANLRYESPWLNELLLANLLAPVGAGSLSQRVSEQEYSRLFERDHFGISSSTTWLSSGDWRQDISQYGTQGSLSYALDGQHWTQNGSRRNEDFGFESFSAKVKLQVTPQDSLFLQSIYFDNAAGDIAQYYDPAVARANLRTREAQEPVLLAGYHHEWSPGVHTLFLAGRLEDTLRVSDPGQRALLVGRDFGGTVDALAPVSLNLRYRSKLEIYTAEAQQIWQRERHSLILGVRGQSGEFDTRSRQTDPTAFTVFFPSPAAQQGVDSDFQRATIYAYENVQLTGRLLLSLGVSYDHLEFPENHRTSPVSDRERRLDQISPKAGLTWLISINTTLRAAYTRSLGGVSLDQSYRLEPVQVAGFTQSYRSGASESLVGSLAGAEFDTYGLALDQRLATGTYVTLAAEILESDVEQTRGAFFFNAVPPIVPGTIEEELKYQEKAVSLSLNQLLGKEWTLGMRYRWSEADLERRFPLVPLAVSRAADSKMDATLHQLQIYAIFNHGSGFFGRTEATWHAQSIGGFGQSGDELWQFNAYVGYRFPRRRAELMAGLLNITDEDYRLNPLTIHSELPRERLLALCFKFNFE